LAYYVKEVLENQVFEEITPKKEYLEVVELHGLKFSGGGQHLICRPSTNPVYEVG